MLTVAHDVWPLTQPTNHSEIYLKLTRSKARWLQTYHLLELHLLISYYLFDHVEAQWHSSKLLILESSASPTSPTTSKVYNPQMLVTVPTKTLPSGAAIPVLGLGVYLSRPGEETYDAVASALKLGYRHIDTAQFFENEIDVGRAIFVTSKLFPTNWGYNKAIEATWASNERLGLKYIDLFVLHAPGDSATRAETWRALEDMRSEGVLKDIGVSSFSKAHYEKLLETARIKPAVNQVELHPWLTRTELVKFFESEGVILQAYSPLAKSVKLSDLTVTQIAEDLKVTTAQVLVAYSLAKGFVTFPKSVTPSHQQENLEAAEIKLSAEQVAKLDALDQYFTTGWDPIKKDAV